MSEENVCKVCNVELFTKQEKIEHSFSLMHHIKLEQTKKEYRKRHSCSLCSVSVGSLKDYVKHLNGSKHIKLLSWQREQWKKRPPNDADIPLAIGVEEKNNGPKKQKGKSVKNVMKATKAKNVPSPKVPSPAKNEQKQLQQKNSSKNSPNASVSPKPDVSISPKVTHPNGNQFQNLYSEHSGNCWHTNDRINNDNSFWQRSNAPVNNYNNRNSVVWQERAQWYPRHMPTHYRSNANFNCRFPRPQSWGYNSYQAPHFNGPHFHRNEHWGNYAHRGTWFDDRAHDPAATQLAENPRNDRSTNDPIDEKRNADGTIRKRSSDRDRSTSGSKMGDRVDRVSYLRESTRSGPSTKDERYRKKDNTDRRHSEDRCRSRDRRSADSNGSSKSASGREIFKPVVLGDRVDVCGHHMNNIKVTVTREDSTVNDRREEDSVQGVSSAGRNGKDGISAKRKRNEENSHSHTYFLSSDSNDEDENETSSPLGKRRSTSSCEKEISSYDQTLIGRLVNFPRTRKQQQQLGRWIQEHARTKRKLVLPRFNLPLGPVSAEKDEESVVEGLVCEVVGNLPDHLFRELVDELNKDSGLQSLEDIEKTCRITAQEEGELLPPWLDFLKSLSRAPSPSQPVRVEQNVSSAGLENATNCTVEVPLEAAPSSANFDVVIKTEPLDDVSETLVVNNATTEIPEPALERIVSPEVPSEIIADPILKEIKTEPPDIPTTAYSDPVIASVWSESPVADAVEQPTLTPPPQEEFAHPPVGDNSIPGSLQDVEENVVPNSAINQESRATPPSADSKTSRLQQGIVSELVDISRKEEELRGELHRVEKMLAELNAKKLELQRDELQLRNRRLKLLEALQGSMTLGQSVSGSLEDSGHALPYNLTYLGTLDGLQGSGLSLFDSTPSTSSAKPAKMKKKAVTKKSSKEPSEKKKKKKKTPKKTTGRKKHRSLELDAEFFQSLPTPAELGIQLEEGLENFLERMIGDCNQKKAEEPITTVEERGPLSAAVSEVEEEPVKFVGPIEAHDSAITDLKVCRGYVYTCSSDQTAKRRDVKVPSSCINYEGHGKTVSALQVTTLEGDGAFVFTASHDRFLRCFDAQSGVCLNQFEAGEPIICMTKEWGKLYLGLNDGSVLPFSITSNRFLDSIRCSNTAISKILAASEGAHRLLCITSYDETVTVRNASTGLLVRCLEGKVKPPSFMQISGNSVYITTAEKKIAVYDLSTGKLERVIKCPSCSTGLCVSGDFVFSCSYDGLIRCYRKKDWSFHALFYGAGKAMTMCMEIDDRWVYTGNRHGVLEGFLFDPAVVLPCRFQNCTYPFGRHEDLKHHLQRDHLPQVEQGTKRDLCPWRGCDASFLDLSAKEIKDHILLHSMTASS